LRKGYVEIMKAAVQMHSPIWESRSVFNLATRQRPLHSSLLGIGKDGRRKHLKQALHPIKCTSTVSIFDDHPRWLYVNGIILRSQSCIHKEDCILRILIIRRCQFESCSGLQSVIQETGYAVEFGIRLIKENLGIRRYSKFTFTWIHVRWFRHNADSRRDRSLRLFRTAASKCHHRQKAENQCKYEMTGFHN
jgi:hypothetical protein